MLKLTMPSEGSSQGDVDAVEEVVVHVQGIITDFKLPPITKQTRLYVSFKRNMNLTNYTQGKWKGGATGNNLFN
jgi:hypothetical protein